MTRTLIFRSAMLGLAACWSLPSDAQDRPYASSLDQPMTRLQPIGAPSAVDRYRSQRESSESNMRQTVMLQSTDGRSVMAPPLPGGSSQGMQFPADGGLSPPSQLPQQSPNQGQAFAPPQSAPTSNGSAGSSPVQNSPVQNSPVQNSPVQNSLPSNPGTLTPVPRMDSGNSSSTSDLQAIPQPQLGIQYATMDNCNYISSPFECFDPCDTAFATPVSFVSTQSQGNVQPPATIPQTLQTMTTVPPSGIIAPPATAAPVRSLFTLGQEANPVQLGQGLWGQPVAYVPGQGIRNWVRYFFP